MNDQFDPTQPIMDVAKVSATFGNYQFIASIVAIVAVIATGIAVAIAWNKKSRGLVYIAIFLWALIPPATFWWEYFYVYLAYGKPGTIELFKYGQQVSGAMWAGILVALIAIASSKHFE